MTAFWSIRRWEMKSLKLALVALACVAAAGCATSRGLEGESGDPVADAKQAFNHGDERLVGFSSISIVIPGVSGDQIYLEKVRTKFGLRYLNGGGNASETYGATYNRTLLTLKGCQLDDPMAGCQR
jgi:hypothetical protein